MSVEKHPAPGTPWSSCGLGSDPRNQRVALSWLVEGLAPGFSNAQHLGGAAQQSLPGSHVLFLDMTLSSPGSRNP